MTPAPGLHTLHRLWTAEVIAIAVLAQPSALAGGLAGLPTGGLETIALPIGSSRIWDKQLITTAAFASVQRAAHRAPNLRGTRGRRKRKRRSGTRANPKKEEDL
jgi:hypothetical protein